MDDIKFIFARKEAAKTASTSLLTIDDSSKLRKRGKDS